VETNKIYQGDALEVLKTFPDNSIDMVITSPPYWGLRDYGVDGQLGQEAAYKDYLNDLKAIFAEVKRVLKPDGTCWVNIGDTYGGTGDKGLGRDPKYSKGRNGQSVSLSKSCKAKSLLQIPSRFAILMTDELDFILRNEIIWHKPNAMPCSVKDRFTVDYEKLYFFTKSKTYNFKQQKEPMRTTDTRSPRGSNGVISGPNAGRRKQDEVGKRTYDDFNNRYWSKPPEDLKRNMRSVWSIPTRPLKKKSLCYIP
jgi:DNA modification methylase